MTTHIPKPPRIHDTQNPKPSEKSKATWNTPKPSNKSKAPRLVPVAGCALALPKTPKSQELRPRGEISERPPSKRVYRLGPFRVLGVYSLGFIIHSLGLRVEVQVALLRGFNLLYCLNPKSGRQLGGDLQQLHSRSHVL